MDFIMTTKINLYNNTNQVNTNQDMYNSFNSFMFSKDRNVFNKLISKLEFYNMTKDLHGDIVECGVFKGSGLMSWLKIIDLYEPHTIKKVIGFDFFDPAFVDKLEIDVDKQTMKQVFSRDPTLVFDDVSLEGLTNKITNAGFDESKFELIKGDVCETTRDVVKERSGLRISILYLDMDLDKPTYETLNNLWDRVVPGGVVVFDEYAYHAWSEADAVDRFVQERGLQLHRTNIKAPTGYIIK
jgi:hypothetical protein